jgi:ABC-type transport system involved in cytochrome c biogenesis permease component
MQIPKMLQKRMGNKGLTAAAGVMSTLVFIALLFVVYTMVQSVGATTIDRMQNTTTVNSFAWNISGTGLSSLTTMANQNGTLITIIVMAGIIAVLIGAFMFFRSPGGRM